ncbi:hypothetical protein SPHINGO391_110012 [Sphingomonas aurantiaca]|uniref:Uncharacterized protein n=1 Tax=Sphingomonas aurantiaca TaxID=185949 RepID=A0A5E7XVR3_9SPHN|nr:hypothetical protein SPHINGO391_110012 [Sphingomonas aurantiaca]
MYRIGLTGGKTYTGQIGLPVF